MADAKQRRAELVGLMGDLPAWDRPIGVRNAGTDVRSWGALEKLQLDLNGIEPVPAYFLKPAREGRWPVVVCCHSHGGRYSVGKEEVFEAAPYIFQPWGEELVRAGYAVLAIDHWAFGERNHTSESDTFKLMLWEGRVMWGMMVYDTLRAIDYLATRPDVDMARVATLGMSMGSTMAWWAAALDERVKVCVDLCCLTDFDALVEEKNLKGHGLYYYVPGLKKHFTCAQINELIVPRAHLGLAGELDALTPTKGLTRIDEDLKKAYRSAGVSDRWRLSTYPVAHQETAGMRAEAMAWLAKWL